MSLQKFEDKMPEVKFEPNANRYGLLLEKTMIEDKDDFDWTLCIDIDEYLRLNEKYTLQSFLKEYSSFPGVCLFWRFMSANGHVQKCKDIVSSYTTMSTFSRYYIN